MFAMRLRVIWATRMWEANAMLSSTFGCLDLLDKGCQTTH